MSDCPNCSAGWIATELTGEAHHGGGYHILCHVCGHEWDDPTASHGAREARSPRRTTFDSC